MREKVGGVTLPPIVPDGVVTLMDTEAGRTGHLRLSSRWGRCESWLERPWASSPTLPRRTLRLGKLGSRHGLFPPVQVIKNTIIAIILVGLLSSPSSAALVNFENCLGSDIINSAPTQLQFVPLFVDAVFNATAPSHNLNVTVYGNVTGRTTQEPLPPPDDPQWKDPNRTLGKILDLSPSNNKYSTLDAVFNVLRYTAYDAPASRFCESVVHGGCPLAPTFTASGSRNDIAQLPAFSVAHDLYSAYIFTTITADLKVKTGDATNATLACVSASITPDLGYTISNLLIYLPAVVLLVVAIATALAAILSPWGTLDVFRWTSNYGRDADLLRLITPGFGDCLQYIQFVVLAGSLTLNYPGFYQPIVSQVSWSVLMFNESVVSHGNGTQSLVDGIYTVNATYGLDQMSQLVGMTSDRDIWAGMMIWLLVIIAALVVLIQIVFACRWGYRFVSDTQEEDLRAKNLPFTVGNGIRVVFNYFLLPVVAFSMYQLVIAGHSPRSTIGLAAIALVAVIGFAVWLLWLVASTRPRSYLFDDLPTVLLYGPLYNTYSDHAAAFALIPVMMTFVRGVAIGAVQPSGIAQLVLLAICEVIMMLTLNAFRPFQSPTSMNVIHTVFAVVRLVTIMLSVAFVPSLNIGDTPRGWIGYVILLLHGITLFVGFFLHSLQTIVEVVARLAGAGGEDGVGGGATRGGLVKVFGMRQLSRRNPRRPGRSRTSIASDAAMLGQENDSKSLHLNGDRSRSMSGSSAILLNRQMAADGRKSFGLDSISAAGGENSHTGSGGAPLTPTTPGGASAFSYVPGTSQNGTHGGGIVNLKSAEAADPYYRPPRPRRVTVDLSSPGARSPGSWASGDWGKSWSQNSPDQVASPDPMEGPSVSGRATPLPAHLGSKRERADSNADDPRHSKTDYAIREVDFYYGVRGPALSNLPTRRLKTGPADPTGPVSSASGWLKSLFVGKTKEKGKGFEVVRSSRVPQLGTPPGEIALVDQKPYKDDPDPTPPPKSRDFELDDEGDAVGGGTRHLPEDRPSSPTSDNESTLESESDEDKPSTLRASQVSQFPPSLPTIETGPEIELPSRITSKASSKPSRGITGRGQERRPPIVPRRSSRRTASQGKADFEFARRARPAIIAPSPSPPSSPQKNEDLHHHNRSVSAGLRPSSSTAQRLPFGLSSSSSHSDKRPSTGGESTTSDLLTPADDSHHNNSGGYLPHSSAAFGSLLPSFRDDRPSSMGYVQQHRASDNVHIANPNELSFHESAAELVNDPNRRSASPERRSLQ